MEYKERNNSRPFKGRDGRDRKDKRRNRNQRNKEERKPLEAKAEKKPVKVDYDAIAKKYKEKYDAMAEANKGYNYAIFDHIGVSMLVVKNDKGLHKGQCVLAYKHPIQDVMLVRTNDGRTFVTPSSNLKRLSFK